MLNPGIPYCHTTVAVIMVVTAIVYGIHITGTRPTQATVVPITNQLGEGKRITPPCGYKHASQLGEICIV